MAGYLTTYGANAILDGTAMPTTLWIKGHLGDPGVNGTANPAAETDRFAFTRAAASLGSASNAARVAMADEASTTEDWTHLSLWSASSGGNPWWIVPLTADLAVVAGTQIVLAISTLVLSFERWS